MSVCELHSGMLPSMHCNYQSCWIWGATAFGALVVCEGDDATSEPCDCCGSRSHLRRCFWVRCCKNSLMNFFFSYLPKQWHVERCSCFSPPDDIYRLAYPISFWRAFDLDWKDTCPSYVRFSLWYVTKKTTVLLELHYFRRVSNGSSNRACIYSPLLIQCAYYLKQQPV